VARCSGPVREDMPPITIALEANDEWSTALLRPWPVRPEQKGLFIVLLYSVQVSMTGVAAACTARGYAGPEAWETMSRMASMGIGVIETNPEG